MGRLKRILRHPAAAVVLLAMLGVSFWSLPKDGRSVIGKWIVDPFDSYTKPHLPLIEVYLIEQNGKLTLHDPEVESFDAISRALSRQPRKVVRATVERDNGQAGAYAITRAWEPRWIHLLFMSKPAELDGSQIIAARAMFIDWLAVHSSEWCRQFAQEARHGEDRRVRVVWSGYIHNAAALVLLAAVLYSLRWNLAPSTWRARVRAARLSRGLCPRCRYPLHGLAENKCPECGERWGTSEEQAARP